MNDFYLLSFPQLTNGNWNRIWSAGQRIALIFDNSNKTITRKVLMFVVNYFQDRPYTAIIITIFAIITITTSTCTIHAHTHITHVDIIITIIGSRRTAIWHASRLLFQDQQKPPRTRQTRPRLKPVLKCRKLICSALHAGPLLPVRVLEDFFECPPCPIRGTTILMRWDLLLIIYRKAKATVLWIFLR